MNKTLTRILTSVLTGALLLAALPSAYAVTGGKYSSAASISVGSSKQVTLVEEIDEDGDTTGYGCYYLKFSLKAGESFTCFSDGAAGVDDGDTLDCEVGAWDKDWEGINGWGAETRRDGVNFWLSMNADEDWWYDEDDGYDPKPGTMYIYVRGTVGATCTVTLRSGASAEPIPSGDSSNPKTITPSTSVATDSTRLIDGEYWYRATLTAGHRYIFWTDGGTAEAPLSLDISASPMTDELPDDDIDDPDSFFVFGDYGPANVDTNLNSGLVVTANGTGRHYLRVVSFGMENDEAQFKLNHYAFPYRTPAQHPDAVDLGVLTTDPVFRSFIPGYRNALDSGAYDPVIDQQLFKFTAVKDSIYHFYTEDSRTNLVMEVYDATGAVLARSIVRSAEDARNVGTAFRAAASGTYWVGVCQDLDMVGESGEPDETGVPAGFPVTLYAVRVNAEDGLRDAADPADDDYAGATGLAPIPATAAKVDPIADGTATDLRTFGLTDWRDWYRIDARKGITYYVQAAIDESVEASLASQLVAYPVRCNVYTLSGTKLVPVLEDENLMSPVAIDATAHTSYYIETWVESAQGMDYGPYRVHSAAKASSGALLGLLNVNIHGPSAAKWQINASGEVQYPSGGTILIASGEQTLKFSTVSGWSTPANVVANVKKGTAPTVVDVYYNDTSDPKDNTVAGAVAIAPNAKGVSVTRSLWSADPADWFKVAVKANTYYDFELGDLVGDATMMLYRDAACTQLLSVGAKIRILAREASTYYLAVAHADANAPGHASYALNATATAVGTIKVDKAAVTVKESATSVAVKVSRTGKEGRTRVRYATQAGTAKPGTEYVPQKGILEWAAGNSAAQTITIDLIPDLVPTWEADKTFSILVEPIPYALLEPDEFVAPIMTPSVTVTLSESAKQGTGTIGFSGVGGANAPFAVPKKPAATVGSGEELVVWLERTDGGDGAVGVVVSTVKGTALPDEDYVEASETISWEDGETCAKPFTLRTLAADAQVAGAKAKTLTLKAAVDNGASYKAKLGVSSVTVTIAPPDSVRTAEEWIAAQGKSATVTCKAATAGAWYFTADGTLRSAPVAPKGKAEFTATVAGPGRFTFVPSVVGTTGSLTWTFGKTTGTLDPSNCGAPVVLYLEKGSQTVKFTAQRDATAANEEFYVFFDPLAEDTPFLWEPLPTAANPVPANKTGMVFADKVHLGWDFVDGVTYKYYVDTNAKNLGTDTCIAGSFEEYPAGISSSDQISCFDCGISPFEPGKTYSWRVDAFFLDDDDNVLLSAPGNVWTFQTAPVGASAVALVLDEADGMEWTDDLGAVLLRQGVNVDFALKAAGSVTARATYVLAGGKLPDGLKLAATGAITGVPTKAGAYTAEFRVKDGTVLGPTLKVDFEVLPLGLATGSFYGIADTETPTSEIDDAAFAVVTTTDAGKITAKVTVAGKAYSFSGTGYAEEVELESGLPGVSAVLSAPVKFGTKTVYNTFRWTANCGTTNDWSALDSLAEWSLTFHVSADKALEYKGGLAVRDPSKVPHVVEAMADFAGYYTVALPCDPTRVVDGVHAGAGYLAVTLDAKGKVKVAGVTPAGTAISCATIAGYQSDDGTGNPAIIIPVYSAKGTEVIEGAVFLVVNPETGNLVADPGESMIWGNSDKNSTRGGKAGFRMRLLQVGGWHDKLVSLQRYYLDYALDLDFHGALPAQFDATYTQAASSPDGMAVKFAADAPVFDKKTLAYVLDEKGKKTKTIDFDASLNPCNVSIKVTRATGLFSGTCSVWYENAAGTLQKEWTGFKFQGILPLERHPDASFVEAAGLGYYLLSEKIGTRTWNGSHLFTIDAEAVENDWSEGW